MNKKEMREYLILTTRLIERQILVIKLDHKIFGWEHGDPPRLQEAQSMLERAKKLMR